MTTLSRRKALGVCVASSVSAVSAIASAAPDADNKPNLRPEEVHTFKLKNVVLDRIDEDAATITVSFGGRQNRSKITDLPVSKEIKIVASLVFPTVGNSLPFTWERLKGLASKPVSVWLRAEANDLSLVLVCSGND